MRLECWRNWPGLRRDSAHYDFSEMSKGDKAGMACVIPTSNNNCLKIMGCVYTLAWCECDDNIRLNFISCEVSESDYGSDYVSKHSWTRRRASKSRGVTTYAESEEKEPVRAEELQHTLNQKRKSQ